MELKCLYDLFMERAKLVCLTESAISPINRYPLRVPRNGDAFLHCDHTIKYDADKWQLPVHRSSFFLLTRAGA